MKSTKCKYCGIEFSTIIDKLHHEAYCKTKNQQPQKTGDEIKQVGEKGKMTAKDLLDSGVVGVLKNRKDIKDSVEYSKKLSDDLLK